MADEEEVNQAPKSPKTMVILLMILSIVIMALTPVVTIYIFKMTVKNQTEEPQKAVESKEIILPKVQVNVAGTNGTRYAQIEVVLEVSDPTMSKFFENQTENNSTGQINRIMAAIIRLVGDKSLNTLLSTDGKDQLANDIKSSLNELFADQTTGMVTDVYFCGFLIQ